MWNKDNIQEELHQVAPGIVDLQHLETFTIPVIYFTTLPAIILNRVNGNIQQSNLETTAAKLPYNAPAGYFDGLAARIMQKVHSSTVAKNEIDLELELIASALIGINKSQVYLVPSGYFENLNIPIVAKPVGKVVSMYSAGKVLRYLAAAVIISVIAFSAYLFFDKSADTGTAKNNIEVSATDNLNVTAAVKTLSEDEILDFLQINTSTDQNFFSPINIPDVDADFNEVIKDLSEDELKAFLNLHSDETKILLKNS